MPDVFPLVTLAVPLSNELVRVSKMPRRRWTDQEMTELAREMTDALKTPRGAMELRPLQAAALLEIGMYGGLFGPIRVGAGKTLVSLLAPVVAFAERPLLLVPAKLVDKTERERRALADHWRLPSFFRIMTYEWLGRAQAADALEAFLPDMIVADEAHKVSNLRAAVTRRVRRHMGEHPEVKFVPMSGTMTKRSLHDYAHMARWSLGPERMFVPRHYTDLEMWADALDERKGQVRRADPGALQILCDEREQELWELDRRAAARSAFRRRMVETPGVIATRETPIDATLTVSAVEPPTRAVDEAFEVLRRDWALPDGTTIADGLGIFQHARELALGFYYIWWNEEGFQKCLTEQKKQKENTLRSTARKTLRDCEPMIANGIDLARAVAHLRKSKRISENGTFSHDTGSQKKGTKNSSQNITDSAISAEKGVSFQATARDEDLSASTMTMSLEKFEDFFAVPATERWRCWATILKDFPELSNIFETAVDAARPPRQWMDARRAWHQFVRRVLGHSRSLDSELQVRRAHAGAPELLEWQAVQPTFEPRTVPVWIDDSVLEFCARWAEENRGIVWTEHVVFGERLERDYGLPYYGRGGLDTHGYSIEEHPPGEPMAASIQSNAEGRNLQAWSTALITSAPANGKQWEQVLGRLHREGQEADEVAFDLVVACAEHVGAFWQAVSDCRYVEQSTGSPQKLLLAGVNVPTADELARRRGARWQKDWA